MPRKRATRSSNSRSTSNSRSAKAPPAPRQRAPPAIIPQQQKNVSSANTQQPTQPGLFGQMASTAAGVAVGSTIGHTLGAGVSSLFGTRGSESDIPQDQSQTNTQPQASYHEPYYQSSTQSTGIASCEGDAKALTKCLEQNNHNISLCQYYLENLKACQQMASQF